MIYFCADDYGLNKVSSMRIKECVTRGVLNKISIFPNFESIDFNEFEKNIRLSLHLNLVEGRCMANADEIPLIADKNGNFKHTFGGLFKLSLTKRKELENQIYKEVKAQILYWKSILPEHIPFCVDSHQHTHMIPLVFYNLIKVLKEESIDPEYIRIPAEPILPYILTPSLYFTYSPVNLIKQWLLKFLWVINKRTAKQYKIPSSYFMGILFSGNMDEKRVTKVLPEYIRLAQRRGKDIEVLFHPGYLTEDECDFKNNNVVFEKFYLSEKRVAEYNSAMKILKGSAK